jgi:alkaline phosphatase
MAGRAQCCRYEPTLDELLDDDVMTPVLRSAGFDPQGFRDLMVETARRIDDRRHDDDGSRAAADVDDWRQR